ncbi:hypothetical protein ACFLXT_04120 [Chloroflexota bacterium]
MGNKSASVKRSLWWHFLRVLVLVFLITGIITAALNTTFGGFTPIIWFLLALIALLIAVCNEVLRLADFLESKK